MVGNCLKTPRLHKSGVSIVCFCDEQVAQGDEFLFLVLARFPLPHFFFLPGRCLC